MSQRLKVLIAEDNPNDADLLVRELRRAGFEPEWTRVDTEPEFVRSLSTDLDLVLSDYEMPQFNGMHALELLKASGIDVPFIIISGTIGEDTAVTAMKLGAADYLLKDRLARLEQAIRHALSQKRLRQERIEAINDLRRSEEKLRSIFDGISAFVGLFTTDGRVIEINDAALKTVALRREDIIGRFFVAGPWWLHSEDVRSRIATAIETAARGATVKEELVAAVMGGQSITVETVFNPLRDSSGRITHIVASGIDVTERRKAEQKNQEQLNELLRWQDVMLGREDRVQTLKAEVNALLSQQHLPERYTNSISR
jgi:PAS domain S-box-containing protein